LLNAVLKLGEIVENRGPQSLAKTQGKGQKPQFRLGCYLIFISESSCVIAPHDAFSTYKSQLIERDIAHIELPYKLACPHISFSKRAKQTGIGKDGVKLVITQNRMEIQKTQLRKNPFLTFKTLCRLS
jgi:hypothetical protein